MIVRVTAPGLSALADLVTGSWLTSAAEPVLVVQLAGWPVRPEAFSRARLDDTQPIMSVDRGDGPLLPLGLRPTGRRELDGVPDVSVLIRLASHPFGRRRLELCLWSSHGRTSATLIAEPLVHDPGDHPDGRPADLILEMDWWRAVSWLGSGDTLFADITAEKIGITGHLGGLSWIEGVRFASGLVEPDWSSEDLVEMSRLWPHAARRLSASRPEDVGADLPG